MSEEWKKWNIELKEAIEQPTQEQLAEMTPEHFQLYTLFRHITEHRETLSELENEFKELKDTLDIKNLPEWCWIWNKKQTSIKWKEEFINRLGKTLANKISAEAKQKEYPQIGIRFIDPNPDNIPVNPDQQKRQQKPKRLLLKPQIKTPLLKLPIRK